MHRRLLLSSLPLLVVLSLFGLAVPALQGQVPYRVADVLPGTWPSGAMEFSQFLPLRGKLVFKTRQDELWATDGTPGGTAPLTGAVVYRFGGRTDDLAFAVGDSLLRTDGTRGGTYTLTSPFELAVRETAAAADGLYFVGCSSSCELWHSDGSIAGTRQVSASSDLFVVGAPIVVGTRVFFFRENRDAVSLDLWSSDGTTSGTVAVSLAAVPAHQAPVAAGAGGLLYFFSPKGSGFDLKVSDGSAAGTRSIASLPDVRVPYYLRASGSHVFFASVAGGRGLQIWRSDGTAKGTVRVTDEKFVTRVAGADLEEIAGRLLFWTSTSTGYSLWSAGHAGSARPHCTAPCQSGFHQLIRVGDRVVFPTFESGGRVDLRATDGLGSGSSLLKTICNQGCNPYAPLPFVTLGSTGYFNVQKERNRSELWQTDGTRAGTRLASTLAPDLAEGVNFLSPPATPIGEIQGQLVFPAGGAQSGIQLWAVRQPTGSRLQLTDVIDPRSASPRFFTVAGDRLYFLEDGVRLWRSDGTTSTTKPVPGAPLQPLGPFCNQAETLYFAADSKQVWRTDGTAEGTFPLTDNVDLDEILGPVCLAGNVYFIFIVTSFASPFPSSALWRSDGTVSGTTLVMDLSPRPTSLTAFESALYINDGSRLLQSDGTAAGTLQLAAVDGDAFLRVGSNVFFFDSLKRDLWKTDGTPSGTTKLVSLAEKGAPYPGDRVAIDGSLYFLGEGSAGSLWRSDGTEEGTVRILATSSEVDLYGPLQALGDHVYFVARTARGRQLWTSDGSSAAALTDPSLQLSDTPPLAAAGRLFFTADDGVHGFELWQTDGTAAGTRRVSDIAPGPLSSWPDSFTQLGDRLYFAAQDSLSGRELWALPLGGEPACVPTDTALCLQGGRFRVEATYWDSTGASFSGHTMALSADTGAFWFFDAANLEVAVKVLDGRPIDGHFWVFYGALSDVEYALTVTDTETGLSRVYQNPAGRLASVGDTTAFGPLGAYDVARPKEPRATASLWTRPQAAPMAAAAVTAGSCVPAADQLCLGGGRFAVRVAWRDFSGHSGGGTAAPLTADTGTFSFFAPGNVELVVKVLDGRPVNGKFWLFYGALSNVEYTLTVTDTATGKVRTYANPAGRFASVGDTSAF